MKLKKNRRLPRQIYDALPYLYACIGVGLLYGLGSGIAFVMGIVLLIATVLVVYMRSSARDRAHRKDLQHKSRRYWDQF
jgi:uncharacterized membrane protein